MSLETRAFTRSLATAAALVEAAARRSIVHAGETVVRDAQRRAPVRTGTLRDSITVTRINDGVELHVNADYAGYVEYGTGDTPPQPYLRPALAVVRSQAQRIFRPLA